VRIPERSGLLILSVLASPRPEWPGPGAGAQLRGGDRGNPDAAGGHGVRGSGRAGAGRAGRAGGRRRAGHACTCHL